ncbi:helix-turn-helix transcriptional regulator [Dyella ginsengisoli]|uniref:Helix-turn-helix transcriptional regulator n=2 Tax=Dyella ginsengisoli TaxID=363848 RepID=A0ABW8JUK8_9GAMM
MSVARSHDPVTAAELERHEMQLLWLAHTAQGLVATLPGMAAPPLEPLSLRECEVLRWSAAGKTADEIGMILAITPRTVAFHINRCIAKLDAANKTEAVAKALVLGLL